MNAQRDQFSKWAICVCQMWLDLNVLGVTFATQSVVVHPCDLMVVVHCPSVFFPPLFSWSVVFRSFTVRHPLSCLYVRLFVDCALNATLNRQSLTATNNLPKRHKNIHAGKFYNTSMVLTSRTVPATQVASFFHAPTSDTARCIA